MNQVGTRSTASATCDAKNRTRWNASLPRIGEVKPFDLHKTMRGVSVPTELARVSVVLA